MKRLILNWHFNTTIIIYIVYYEVHVWVEPNIWGSLILNQFSLWVSSKSCQNKTLLLIFVVCHLYIHRLPFTGFESFVTYRAESKVEPPWMANVWKGYHPPEYRLAVMETESAHCLSYDFPGSFSKEEDVHKNQETNAHGIYEYIKQLQ